MGRRKDLQIWVGSLALAAVAGVAVGGAYVGVMRFNPPAARSAGALPIPSESGPGRPAPAAAGSVSSVGPSTVPLGRSTVAAVSTTAAKVAPAGRQSGAAKKAHPAAKAPKAKATKAPKATKSNGKSESKPKKPEKAEK